MRQKAVGQAFGSVLKFNEIAGQLNQPDRNSIALQLDLIQEEYLEGVEAFDNEDRVELLDAACDMWVVVSGLLQKLEAMGYNVEEALSRICENNLSKFPSTANNAENSWNAEYVATFNKKHQVLVLKDKNGKVRKHDGYKPVDLSDLVPSNLVPGGVS